MAHTRFLWCVCHWLARWVVVSSLDLLMSQGYATIALSAAACGWWLEEWGGLRGRWMWNVERIVVVGVSLVARDARLLQVGSVEGPSQL